MEDRILLSNSTFCRLCAEENENGILLFPSQENDPDLSSIINRYLPIKIQNDGKLPRTICPGCNIQLDAMVQFLNLIVNGQEKIRELWRNQLDFLRRKEKEKLLLEQTLFNSEVSISPFTIQALGNNGEEILIQIMPDGSLYAPDQEISLKIEGLDKPRRKRGRPPKPPPGTEEPVEIKQEVKLELETEEEEVDGRKRRRRKVPSRYREAVQGIELERMFREEGVIDEEDESEEQNRTDDFTPLSEKNDNEIIGHLENRDGQDLGELIIANKCKTRLKSRFRKRQNFNCDICNCCFSNYGRYLMHKSTHKDVQYECIACKKLYNNKDEVKKHQEVAGHEDAGILERLPEEVQDENELRSGMIELPEHKCHGELCDKSFLSKESYEVHIKAIHEVPKPFQCDKCDKTFIHQSNLREHMTFHDQKTDKGYPCDLCDKLFNHPSSVVYHKEAEHNNGRRFVCNKCGKNFKHKQLLQRHQLVHTDDRPFVCKACGASFKTKANLLNHQPTHTGVKKYYCQQCGQHFAHKTSLTLHYRWHSGQKPYECSVCKKAFSQKGNLQEHKRIHTGEKPYTCDVCDRKFTTSSQFKLHVKRHTGERPWICEYCSKTFLHKDTWKCHMRRHRNERPYQCNLCFRDFTEHWALKKHLRLHTGEKPYVCEYCHKAFADCSNLTKHKKTHKIIKDEFIEEQTEGNVIYVTYQNSSDANDLPALVHILDETTAPEPDSEPTSLGEVSESIDNSLIASTEQPSELSLDDFNETTASLPLTAAAAGQLHVTDEEGNPIYFTAQNGQQMRVTSFDGQNLQVCMDDGSFLPIQLNSENGKVVAVELPELSEEFKNKNIKMEDEIIISELGEESKSNSIIMTNDSLMDQSMQFMTSDGQNVCLVTTFNIESDAITPSYLPIA